MTYLATRDTRGRYCQGGTVQFCDWPILTASTSVLISYVSTNTSSNPKWWFFQLVAAHRSALLKESTKYRVGIDVVLWREGQWSVVKVNVLHGCECHSGYTFRNCLAFDQIWAHYRAEKATRTRLTLFVSCCLPILFEVITWPICKIYLCDLEAIWLFHQKPRNTYNFGCWFLLGHSSQPHHPGTVTSQCGVNHKWTVLKDWNSESNGWRCFDLQHYP